MSSSNTPAKSVVVVSDYAANTEDMQHNVPQTVAEGILALAYVFVLFIITTSEMKSFKSAFYVIFVATGATDIISILVSCFNRLNRQLGLGPALHVLVSVSIFISGTTFLSHMIGNMLITINRYSALCLMKKYDKIWTGRNVCIMIVVQYVVALATFVHVIGTKVVYTRNDDGTFTYIGVEPSVGWGSFLFNIESRQCSASPWFVYGTVLPVTILLRIRIVYFVASLIYAIASLILNARLFIEWRKLTKNGDSSRNNRYEKGLLLYTALVFVSTMLMCAQQISKSVATLTKNAEFDLWATMQFYWINDVMLCVPPFCLLMLSTDLRKDILNFVRCRRQRSDPTGPVSVRQSTVGKH